MRPWEVKRNIGMAVVINGNRDLGMNSEHRRLIGRTCLLVKQCKNGLLQINHSGQLHSLPMSNVDVKKKTVSLKEIDFDNDEQVDALRNEIVEIPVGALAFLLGSYYTGGGQPNLNSERLKQVLVFGKMEASND